MKRLLVITNYNPQGDNGGLQNRVSYHISIFEELGMQVSQLNVFNNDYRTFRESIRKSNVVIFETCDLPFRYYIAATKADRSLPFLHCEIDFRFKYARHLKVRWIKTQFTGVYYRLKYVIISRISDGLIVLSKADEGLLRKLWGCPYYIPNTILNIDEPKGIRKKGLIIGSRNHPMKDLDSALEIATQVSKKRDHMCLELFGGKKVTSDFESNRITVVNYGYIKEPFSVCQGNIFLFTSKSEGFPLVLLEALNLGCLPVCLDRFPAAYDIFGESSCLCQNINEMTSFVSEVLNDHNLFMDEFEYLRTRVNERFTREIELMRWREVINV